MQRPETIFTIDDLSIDPVRRKVSRDGIVVSLSALSYDTLKALLDAAPAPLTSDELIDRAWKGASVSDETVTQRIKLLRQALGDDTRQPRYIETLRSAGYRLIPPVVQTVTRPATISRRPSPHGTDWPVRRRAGGRSGTSFPTRTCSGPNSRIPVCSARRGSRR